MPTWNKNTIRNVFLSIDNTFALLDMFKNRRKSGKIVCCFSCTLDWDLKFAGFWLHQISVETKKNSSSSSSISPNST